MAVTSSEALLETVISTKTGAQYYDQSKKV